MYVRELMYLESILGRSMYTMLNCQTYIEEFLGLRRQLDIIEHHRHSEAIGQWDLMDNRMKWRFANFKQNLGLLIRQRPTAII